MKKIFITTILSILLVVSLIGTASARYTEHNRREVITNKWTFNKDVDIKGDLDVDGTIQGIIAGTTGNVFFVDSGSGSASDTTSHGSKDNPFATLDYAIGQCTANNGDVIVLASGHTEQASSYNQEIFDADVAGIKIIGLGVGSDIPTFENGETTASCVIGAANVVISNIRLIPEARNITVGLEVEAAGDDVILDKLDFPEPSGSTAYEFTRMITLASGSDRYTIQNSSFVSADDTGCNNAIDLDAGVQNGGRIINNYMYGQFDESAIHSDDADLEVQLFGNDVTNLTSGQFAIEFTSTATGSYAYNTVYTDAEATSIDPGSMKATGPNWVTTAIDTSPVLFPAQDDQAQNFIGANNSDNAAVTSTTAANEDGSILERLEQIQEAVNKGSGTPLGTNQSIIDSLGSSGDTIYDDATAISGILGVNDANNAFASTNVAPNTDGSILERLEQLQEAINPGTGTALDSTKSIIDAIGATGATVVDDSNSIAGLIGVNDADNAMDSSNIVSNENGSILERLEQVQEAINKGSGTALGTNKSVLDAIGSSGDTVIDDSNGIAGLIGVNDANNAMDSSNVASNADGSVFERLEFLQSEQSGSYLVVTSSVTSSQIPNNTQTGGAITAASSGGLILEDIYVSAGASGATGYTNLEFSTDNVGGPTGADDPIVVESGANFDAAQQFSAIADGDTEKLPIYLESGKKIYIHGDDAAGTGAGTITVNMVFRRVTDGATITGADLSP